MSGYLQCLQNYIGTSAFVDVSYLMSHVETIFLYKNEMNTFNDAVIGWCWWI